jgi:hypothetical protein
MKKWIIGLILIVVIALGYLILRPNNEAEDVTFEQTYTVIRGSTNDRLSVDGVIVSSNMIKYYVGDYVEDTTTNQLDGFDTSGLEGFGDFGGLDVGAILGGDSGEPASSTSRVSEDVEFLVSVGDEVQIGDELWSYEVFDADARVREFAEFDGYVTAVAQNGAVTINGFDSMEVQTSISDEFLDKVNLSTPVIILYSQKQYRGYIESLDIFASDGTRGVTVKFSETPPDTVHGATVDVYFIDESITSVVDFNRVYVSDDRQSAVYFEDDEWKVLELNITGSGEIVSTKIVEHFYEDGFLDEVVVEVGDVVKRGQSVAYYTVNSDNEYSKFDTEYVHTEVAGVVTLVDEINGIVEVQDLTNLEIDFNVKQRLGHKIEVGQKVVIEYNNVNYDGVVSFRAPILNLEIDPNNPHYMFEAQVESEDDFLMVNGEVKVSVLVDQFEDVLLIPVESVYTQSNGNSVSYYVDKVIDGTLVPTMVELESGSFDGKYMVLSGLNEMDVIKVK